MIREVAGAMERSGDAIVFCIMPFGDHIIYHVPVLRSGMHPHCFALVSLLEESVCDGEIEGDVTHLSSFFPSHGDRGYLAMYDDQSQLKH